MSFFKVILITLLALTSAAPAEAGLREFCSRLFYGIHSAPSHGPDPIAAITSRLNANSKRLFPPLEGWSNDLFRGFVSSNYGEKALARYFRGNREYEIRSWAYSRIFHSKSKLGMSVDRASFESDIEIVKLIQRELDDLGSEHQWKSIDLGYTYYTSQVRSTLRGKPEKTASAIAFDRGKPNYAIRYIAEDLKRELKKTNSKSLPVGILAQVSETTPRGVGTTSEYYVLSHVPIRDVTGAYVAIPKNLDANSIDWYFIKIIEREPDGAAKTISISKATLYPGDLPKHGPELFRASTDNRDGLRNARNPHPILRSFLESFISSGN